MSAYVHRGTCDCGNPVPLNSDGQPIYKDASDWVCERCAKSKWTWRKSRHNPDNKKHDGVARAIVWSAWGCHL